MENIDNKVNDKDEQESQSPNNQKEELKAIGIAYQTLPQMIAFEGQKAWNALSVFIQLAFVLTAGAIVPNFLPDASEFVIAVVGLGLSFCGCAATIIWLSFDKRYRKISRYWVLSMREIEENLSNSVVAFQRGRDFADGIEIMVSGEKLRYRGIERISVRTGFLIIYLVFLTIFIMLALYNGFRLVQALKLL